MTTKVPTVGFVSLGCPKAGSDAERDAIVAKLCAELTRREHLRFTRLQVQDLSANGEVQGGVRWRQCQ